MTNKTTWKLKERKERKERDRDRNREERNRKNKLTLVKGSAQSWLSNGIWKHKHIQIWFKEQDKVGNQVSSWIPVFIQSLTLIKDMSSWFNGILPARAAKLFSGEEF